MKRQRKPLSTKKPPIPSDNYEIIKDWMTNRVVPNTLPIVEKTDSIIRELIPNLQYAIKWGNAFYGSQELGWIIEIAAFEVSVNIVFLSGAKFDSKPPLENDSQSRYVKLKTLENVGTLEIRKWIQQAGRFFGWK